VLCRATVDDDDDDEANLTSVLLDRERRDAATPGSGRVEIERCHGPQQ